MVAAVQRVWRGMMAKLGEWLELWTAAKDDKTIAWTLGIGWACAGGGLAGGCLVCHSRFRSDNTSQPFVLV